MLTIHNERRPIAPRAAHVGIKKQAEYVERQKILPIFHVSTSIGLSSKLLPGIFNSFFSVSPPAEVIYHVQTIAHISRSTAPLYKNSSPLRSSCRCRHVDMLSFYQQSNVVIEGPKMKRYTTCWKPARNLFGAQKQRSTRGRCSSSRRFLSSLSRAPTNTCNSKTAALQHYVIATHETTVRAPRSQLTAAPADGVFLFLHHPEWDDVRVMVWVFRQKKNAEVWSTGVLSHPTAHSTRKHPKKH